MSILDGLLAFFDKYESLLTPVITAFFTLMLFMSREFWETRRDRRRRQKEQLDVFRVYGYPLLIASESLVRRLQEMFLTKPRFLRKDAPNIEFYQYTYVSTLYRLCSVLGWIRAIRREVANLKIGESKVSQDLEEAISNFQDALASNHFSVGEQVIYLADRWGLDHNQVSDEAKRNIEKDIEKLVWEYMSDKEHENAHKLPTNEQMELLSRVNHMVVEALNADSVADEKMLSQYRSTCISVVSRRVSWIYKDWQRAIGDFMLERVDAEETVRRLELKPFQEFEDEYLDFLEHPEKHRWLGRINRLFYDLRPNSTETVDARSQQLKNVANKLVDLIAAIRQTGVGTESVTDAEMDVIILRDKQVMGL